MTVLKNKGAIGLSIAGVDDPFKLNANILMMAERLFGTQTAVSSIKDYLEQDNIEVTPENIEKVKAFFPKDRVWKDKHDDGS
jgi:predicted acetyltransferase